MDYETERRALYIQLMKMQRWVQSSGARVVLVFEGRDAAGKGGAIRTLTRHLNPRVARIVALSKPTESERRQWYFQRYVAHFPSGGEISIFDRSWYNRAGIERVLGFCSADETEKFLVATPELERIWTRDGIRLVKYYLSISKEEQARRLEKRKSDPLKHWKITPIDEVAQAKWDEYTRAADEMFARTSTPEAPWVIFDADDKKRARLELMRHLLGLFPS